MAKALTAAQKKTKSRVMAYHKVFGTPEGQKVLADLMNEHWVIRSTFSKDPNLTHMHEGERNVVLRILALLKTNPSKMFEHIDQADEQATGINW